MGTLGASVRFRSRAEMQKHAINLYSSVKVVSPNCDVTEWNV